MSQFFRNALFGVTILSSVSFAWADMATAVTQNRPSYASLLKESRADNVKLRIKTSVTFPWIFPWEFFLYNLDEPNTRYFAQAAEDISLDLPKGRWMFVMVLNDLAQSTPYFIVRDNIEVNEDMTIEISDVDAKNHMTLKTLLPNGEEAIVNKTNSETREILEKGNVRDISQTIAIFRKNSNIVRVESLKVFLLRTFDPTYNENIDYRGDFYISDLPEDMWLVANRECTTENSETYYSTYTFGNSISKDIEVTNNAPWIKVESDFGEIPESDISAQNGGYYQYCEVNSFDNRDMDGMGTRSTFGNGKPYFYISCDEPKMEGLDSYRLSVFPGKALGYSGTPDDPRDFYTILAPGVMPDDGKTKHMVYQFDDGGGMPLWYNKEKPEFKFGCEFYYHPRFSWEQGESDPVPVYGNNVPVTVFSQTWGRDFNMNCWFIDYVGRYGEQRFVDKQVAKATVEADGVELTSDIIQKVLAWSYKGFENTSKAADWKVTMSNENIIVDGNNASNLTVSEFNTGREDFYPPTLTMLNFRNADDLITDRFDKPADGTLEFSAADFIPNETEDKLVWYECQNLDGVKVEYSAEDADTWRELAVTEVPELFFSPGYGGFYRGSLKDVVNNSPTSWYDLRVTVTDKAGNTQTQTLSPAFRIDEQVSLDNLMADSNVTVSVEGSQLTVTGASDNAVVEVYDLAGRKVIEAKSLSVSLDGFMGAYIVKVTDGDNINTFKIGL